MRESEIVMSNMSNGVKNLRYYRQLDGAWRLDDSDRYYRLDDSGNKVYGYRTHLTGSYVCYTDGHLCECEGEGESDDVETVSWSSSNPTGEVR